MESHTRIGNVAFNPSMTNSIAMAPSSSPNIFWWIIRIFGLILEVNSLAIHIESAASKITATIGRNASNCGCEVTLALSARNIVRVIVAGPAIIGIARGKVAMEERNSSLIAASRFCSLCSCIFPNIILYAIAIKNSPPIIRKEFIPIPNALKIIAPNIQKIISVTRDIKVARMQIDRRSFLDIPSPEVTLAKTGIRPRGSTVTKIKMNVSREGVSISDNILS